MATEEEQQALVANLRVLKEQCVDGESLEEHEVHRVELEQAYANLAALNGEDIPPTVIPIPGEVTEITADVTVAATAE